MANDSWFRGLELKYGPDGGVYRDRLVRHRRVPRERRRQRPPRERPDLQDHVRGRQAGEGGPGEQSDEELARLQLHANDWYVRTARRLLQERAAAGRDLSGASRAARRSWRANRRRDGTGSGRSGPCTPPAAWTRRPAGPARQPSQQVRAWGVRLLCDDGPPSAGRSVTRFAELAEDRPEPESPAEPGLGPAAPPVEQRWPIAEALASHTEDASDRDAPLDDLVRPGTAGAGRSRRAVALLARCQNPMRLPVHRPADGRRPTPRPDWPPLSHCSNRGRRGSAADLLIGTHERFRAASTSPEPEGWPDAFAGLLADPT